MRTYRLVIHQHGRLLGQFDSATPWARDAVAVLAARLPESHGFELELLVAEEERRILDVHQGQIRVLCAEPQFVACNDGLLD